MSKNLYKEPVASYVAGFRSQVSMHAHEYRSNYNDRALHVHDCSLIDATNILGTIFVSRNFVFYLRNFARYVNNFSIEYGKNASYWNL